jgi:predicted Fe-S protein YdhL (DUF1289 family)
MSQRVLLLVALGVAAALGGNSPDAPLSHQIKVVETIFCKGMSGECENVTSWEELKRAEERAKIQAAKDAAEAKRLRLEKERKEEARREYLANITVAPIGKSYGGKTETRIAGNHTYRKGSVIIPAGTSGSSHNGSRHDAYFPEGLPPGGTTNLTVMPPPPSPEELAAMEKERTKVKRWQQHVHRFPHQREEHTPELPPSQAPKKDTTPQSTTASTSPEASDQPSQTSTTKQSPPRPSMLQMSLPNHIVQHVQAEAKAGLPPRPALRGGTTASRDLADVPHYHGFLPVDLDFDIHAPDSPLFPETPRQVKCDHRFAYKCHDGVPDDEPKDEPKDEAAEADTTNNVDKTADKTDESEPEKKQTAQPTAAMRAAHVQMTPVMDVRSATLAAGAARSGVEVAVDDGEVGVLRGEEGDLEAEEVVPLEDGADEHGEIVQDDDE